MESHAMLYSRPAKAHTTPTSSPTQWRTWPHKWIACTPWGYADTGGRTSHVSYHRPDGGVKDIPSREMPVRDSCTWSVQWIEPKPMHAVKIGGLLRGPLRSPRVLPPSALNLGAIRRAESSS